MGWVTGTSRGSNGKRATPTSDVARLTGVADGTRTPVRGPDLGTSRYEKCLLRAIFRYGHACRYIPIHGYATSALHGSLHGKRTSVLDCQCPVVRSQWGPQHIYAVQTLFSGPSDKRRAKYVPNGCTYARHRIPAPDIAAGPPGAGPARCPPLVAAVTHRVGRLWPRTVTPPRYRRPPSGLAPIVQAAHRLSAYSA
jgi:hypothetical protein